MGTQHHQSYQSGWWLISVLCTIHPFSASSLYTAGFRNSLFLKIDYFIYFSNVVPPSWSSFHKLSILSSHPFASKRVFPNQPTHPLLPSISLCWSIKPPQDQGPPLPLMPDKAILCYICCWSHGSFHMYSLVSGLVPGNSGNTG